MAHYAEAVRVQQSVGPTITAAIDFMDGAAGGDRFVIEDDGFPNLLLNTLRASMDDAAGSPSRRSLVEHFNEALGDDNEARGHMLWLGAGVDAADGELRLDRSLLPPFGHTLELHWNPERSQRVIEGILALHRRMTEVTGGRPGSDLGWRVFRTLLTLHPLGGCSMAGTPEAGVVDHLGQVFGHPNLYVVDGAVVPVAIGRNPSHTIAALAERIAAHVT
jgi:cholesterol oxidase